MEYLKHVTCSCRRIALLDENSQCEFCRLISTGDANTDHDREELKKDLLKLAVIIAISGAVLFLLPPLFK